MKKILTLAFVGIISGITVFAQQKDIQFTESSHKFGKIVQNVPVTHIFTFTNTSAKPAVIEFASAECGCTTPEYSKEAIPKGKSSTIKVTFNAVAMGDFKKNVTVKFAHAIDPYILTIEGSVIPAKPKSKK